MLLFMLAKDVRDFAISLSAKEAGGCYLLVKCLRIKGRELQSYTQMTWLCQQLFLGSLAPGQDVAQPNSFPSHQGVGCKGAGGCTMAEEGGLCLQCKNSALLVLRIRSGGALISCCPFCCTQTALPRVMTGRGGGEGSGDLKQIPIVCNTRGDAAVKDVHGLASSSTWDMCRKPCSPG